MTVEKIVATPTPLGVTDKINEVITELEGITDSTFQGYWEAGETVEVGDVRYLTGRDNTGYILECVEAGTTGSTQPEIEVANEVANYAEVGRVGQVRVIFNLAEKDVDEVMAMGITYSRLTYPELWEWAGKRAGLIISEEEWQAKFAETNGKFVPYYSSGDGSSTFRTPLLGAYLKGAESSADVGKYVDAGLPNITGDFLHYMSGVYSFGAESIATGAFTKTQIANRQTLTKSSGTYSTCALGFDASLANSIYDNSDTVTPETMTGIWVIKAVGVVVDSGETDIAQVLTATEQVQERVSVVEDELPKKANLGALSMPSTNAIKVNWDGFVDYTSNMQELFYTIPADGWINLAAYTRGQGIESYLGIAVIEPITTEYDYSYLKNILVYADTQRTLSTTLPVSKGYRIRALVGNCMTPSLTFIYAQSEV